MHLLQLHASGVLLICRKCFVHLVLALKQCGTICRMHFWSQLGLLLSRNIVSPILCCTDMFCLCHYSLSISLMGAYQSMSNPVISWLG